MFSAHVSSIVAKCRYLTTTSRKRCAEWRSRKNWLFCGSDQGGHTAAVLFSMIATCDRHQVNPFAYLKDVLTRIAAHPMRQLAELLPEQWKLLSV